MVKTKIKKAVSLVLATVMSLTTFTGIATLTSFAATGEQSNVYIVDFPRNGDSNNNDKWGHRTLKLKNGWNVGSANNFSLRAMGSYSGNIAYCIEPGTGQYTGDTLTEKNENYFNNISENGAISGDDIRLLIGRILQYGYRGGISTEWKSQNESDANCIAHAFATQILIWETIAVFEDADRSRQRLIHYFDISDTHESRYSRPVPIWEMRPEFEAEVIDTNTFGKSTGRSGNYSTNYQISGRELLTPDEVRMLDNQYAILFIRGERPVMDFKYDILKHPNVALTTDGKASGYKHGEVTVKHSSISVLSIDPEELPEESYGETNYELLSDEDFEVNKNLY